MSVKTLKTNELIDDFMSRHTVGEKINNDL
jgi:hypothetical protein